MNLQAKRKELTELVDNIKEHSDRLTQSHTLPALELSVLLSKISKLHEEIIILKYELTNTEFKNVEQLLEREPLKKDEVKTDSSSDEYQNQKDIIEKAKVEDRKESITTDSSTAKDSDDIKEIEDKKETSSLNFEPINYQEDEAHIVDNNFEDNPVENTEKATENLDKKVADIQPYEVDFQDLNSKLSAKEDKSIVDQLQKQPIADLTTAIGLNERYLYANELFEGRMDDLKIALKELNTKGNRVEALDYFDNQLIQNNKWEAKNELVLALRLLVERRFK